MAADVRPNSVIKFARFELLKRFKKKVFFNEIIFGGAFIDVCYKRSHLYFIS